MKKSLILLLILIITIKSFGQIGFLGKRNVISSDIFNTFFQKKYNLNYYYCLSKYNMCKVSYSLNRYSKTIILSDENNYYTGNKNDALDIFLKDHSWEVGIDCGSFNFTNMPMPIGYYFGVAFEHYSGKINETRIINNAFSPPVENKYKFDNKANIIKFIYGNNSYIKYNFIVKTSLELGFYIVSALENDSSNATGSPYMVLPLSNPIKNHIKYNDIFNKKRKVAFYIMPNISLGYIF